MSKIGTVWRYSKIALKSLFVLLIIFVYGLLFVRMCSVDDIPDEFKNIYVNDALIELYNSEGGEEKFIFQTLTKYNTDEESYGYFSAASVMLAPEAGQVQVIIKYNISTLEKLKEDYKLSVSIDRNRTDTFEFSLVVKSAVEPIVEGVPEGGETVDYNHESNYTLTRLYPVKTEFLSAGRHNYIRCVFEGVDLDLEDTLGVFCDINYKDDIKYKQTDEDGKPLGSFASICVYNYTFRDKVYKFTDADIEALKAN
ncbi:MAG: hypothetical protein E7601_08040 [Ruminococcaceae bacterium]|nr:hypothetical protein [Oscillospiraceae bacterium]